MSDKKSVGLDQSKSDKFAEKMMTILNYGALNFLISIGYRTGLLDAMGKLPPSTPETIAKKSNLNERYVREWLGAMFTGGIVVHDHEKNTYMLPPEHAAWLTREATPNNIAVTTQWVSVLGSVEDKIVKCFKNGGGVTYEDYNRFHEVMADESYQTVIVPLLDQILPLVPRLGERLEGGIEVLDVGCGSGFALAEMARAFPKSRFTGYEFSGEAVERGRKNAIKRGLKNLSLEVKDAAHFDEKKKYDLIVTFDAVHDQAEPDRVLSNIYRALKDDGVYIMQDIAGSSHVHKNTEHPIAPFLYTISCMHCMSVSLAQNGKGLGAMWGKEMACEMLEKAGFKEIDVKQLPHDPINYYYIVRK